DLGLTGWPAVAEEAIIARDVLLTQHVDSRLHICHLSTKGSVDIVRWAKERGVAVTAEVTPHHLLLTDELVRTFDPVYKVNPPLRTDDDVQALRRAVAEGTIDVIGTDHAPHTAEDKECEWSCAAHGMTGLETALAVVQSTLVDTGLIGWERVAQIMSRTPARILGLTDQGQELAPGATANIVLWDPSGQTPVDPTIHASKGRNSPYRGMTLPGGVRATFYRGHPVVRDGEPATPLTR
ncbi:dihydroorotase, partial [Kocuria sp. UBA1838]